MTKAILPTITAFICITLLLACKNNSTDAEVYQNVNITGTVKNSDADRIYFMYTLDGVDIMDSTAINNGQFEFKGGSFEYPLFTDVMVGNVQFWYDHIYLENGNIHLDITIDDDESKSNLIASGTPTNDEYYKVFTPLYEPYMEEWTTINEQLEIAIEEDRDTNAIIARDKILTEKIIKIHDDYVRSHPDSYVAAQYISDNLAIYQTDRTLNDIYNSRSERIKNSPTGKTIKKVVDIFNLTQPGNEAPEIDLPNLLGENIQLTSLRGQYVLLDFWATWCSPCVAEFPKLEKLRKQYHHKGFEIYGISIDYSETLWSNYLKKKGTPWVNVLDKDEKTAKNYGIDAIPIKHLIDPEGKIALSFVKTEELEAFLEEHL